ALSTTPHHSQIYTLSLHDALPISSRHGAGKRRSSPLRINPGQNDRLQSFSLFAGETDEEPSDRSRTRVSKEQPLLSIAARESTRSEEHTSELQSRFDLVCRLLLEK